MPKTIAPALIALLLTGCTETLLKADSSPAFVDGYNDGCATGSAKLDPNATPNHPVKNAARYNAEPDYANGWQNGLRECDGSDMANNPNNPNEQIDVFGEDWY